jgi:hypothetical protein
VITLKKSGQWDIEGVFALILGLGTAISLFSKYLPIQFRDTPSDFILWLIASGIAILFSVMGFTFGFLEGKKEEQRQIPKLS